MKTLLINLLVSFTLLAQDKTEFKNNDSVRNSYRKLLKANTKYQQELNKALAYCKGAGKVYATEPNTVEPHCIVVPVIPVIPKVDEKK